MCDCGTEGIAVTLKVGEEIDAAIGPYEVVIRLTWVGEGEATITVVEK